MPANFLVLLGKRSLSIAQSHGMHLRSKLQDTVRKIIVEDELDFGRKLVGAVYSNELVLFVGIVNVNGTHVKVTLVGNAVKIRKIRHGFLNDIFGTSSMHLDGFCGIQRSKSYSNEKNEKKYDYSSTTIGI